MNLGLTGKVALVCGASQGIGRATAAMLAREGATVTLCARGADALARVARELADGGAAVDVVAADLATTDGLAIAIDTVKERHGHVDVLVTNTGGPPTGVTLDLAWSSWERASELLLRSVIELNRAFVPGMRERGWGRVIGITSLAVKRPEPSLALSNALRAAVTGYYRTLADEVAESGVTVNTVMPGYTETERLQALADAKASRTGSTREAAYEHWRSQTPMRRLGRPEEIAAVIAFLASDPAGYVTGQSICVDGGNVRTLL